MSKRAEMIARRRRQKRQGFLTSTVIVVGLAVAIAALTLRSDLDKEKEIIISEPQTFPYEDDTSLGKTDAPVVIQGFSDFQCSHCRNFHRDTLPLIIENYVVSGQVRFEFRQFPFLGTESLAAANASLCAAEQDRFWGYSELLFANQANIDRNAFSSARLRAFAEALELNMDQFSSCLDEGRYHDKVDDELASGKAGGINSTPSFLINGQLLVGAAPFTDFQLAIESALLTSD